MIVYCISFTTIFKVLLVIFLIAFDRNRYIATNTISLIVLTNQSEKKGKVLTKHRPHGGKAATVLLELFINGNESAYYAGTYFVTMICKLLIQCLF